MNIRSKKFKTLLKFLLYLFRFACNILNIFFSRQIFAFFIEIRREIMLNIKAKKKNEQRN